ncbi:MAG: insulinase family protein [Verrucomicrobia bacterium]|nr:insulinase family protein [Verrucomicrobiota bacterium]
MRRLICCVALILISAAPYKIIEDKVTVPTLTPSLAQCKIAKIELPNGLEAYLISDPDVKQSAAALAVEAGSLDDSTQYPGIAHFLEHMLFMGTKAYPEEADYWQYINGHSGTANAFTAPDRTVYMFSINNDAYKGALDRFSHFFIDPLFSTSSVSRELHAVNQEHAKNIENDPWRIYMICKETGNPKHPNARFSTGNAETLRGIPQSALISWYESHYSSDRMHFVSISSLPIEEMISLTVQHFSAVPQRATEPQQYPFELFSDAQRGHFLYIQPVRDMKVLSLAWQAPAAYAFDIERKPLSVVAFALSSATKNSLREELIREGLADDVRCDADHFTQDQTLFNIDISLTEEGAKNVNTVIERTFQAIARMQTQGIPSYIFDEMQTMATLNYEYRSRDDVFKTINDMGAHIIDEPLATFPQKSAIPSIYDPVAIAAVLKSLKPESCLYIVCADPKLTGVTPDKQEKWMNAKYALRPIDSKQLQAWAQLGPHPSIDLPRPNPYIPKNLSLIAASVESNPTLLTSSDKGKIYFSSDARYFVPKTSCIYGLKTPLMDGSAKATVLFDLYSDALQEKLAEDFSYASAAGIQCQLVQKDLSYIISTTGYSEKTPKLLQTVFSNLRKVHPSREEFAMFKEARMADYENISKNLPVMQAIHLLQSILLSDAPSGSLKARALQDISYEEFVSFCQNVFQSTYIQGVVHGNLTQPDAKNLQGTLQTSLASSPYPESLHHQKKILVLSNGQGPYRVSKTTPRQGNAVILMLQEGPFSFERKAAQLILSDALEDSFFDTLRTKQQTGYIAKSWNAEYEKQLLQLFAVQSITHHPHDLLSRFELYLEDIHRNFPERVPQDRFETLRTAAIELLSKPPENLSLMTQRYFDLAFNQNGDFAFVDKQIEAVKAFTYDQLAAYADEFLSRKNLKRLAVLMEGVLPQENLFRYEEISQEELTHTGKFISSR